MKILMALHAVPYPPESGATKRIFHILAEVAKRHEVSVVGFGTAEQERLLRTEANIPLRHVHFIDRKLSYLRRWMRILWFLMTGRSSMRMLYDERYQRTIDRLAAQESFDVVYCSVSLLGFYRFPAMVPSIGDNQNVEHDNEKRAFQTTRFGLRKLFYFIDHILLKRDELNCCRKFDILLTPSERDRQLFLKDLPDSRIHVIKNGVDLGHFLPSGTNPEPHSMVFTGVMNYYPNEQGVLYFLDEIMPLIVSRVPDARAYIVGAYPSKNLQMRKTDNVTITGRVDDVRPFMARSSVYIIPLRSGGGTRLKALEAMAMKKPIVSTTLGCEGINLKDGESAMFADSPERFADAVVRLFDDTGLKTALVEKAYTNVVAEYSWTSIGNELEEIICSMGGKNERSAERQVKEFAVRPQLTK